METQFGISNVNTYLFEMDNFTPPIFEDHLGKKDLCWLESAKDVSVLLERNEDKLSEMSVLVRNVTRFVPLFLTVVSGRVENYSKSLSCRISVPAFRSLISCQ